MYAGEIVWTQPPSGSDTYLCGKCKTVIYQNVDGSRMQAELLTCSCGAVLRLPPSPSSEDAAEPRPTEEA